MGDKNKSINCGWCGCFTIVFLALWAIALTVIAATQLFSANNHSNSLTFTKSEALKPTPFGQKLDGSGAPLLMTFPVDYVGFIDQTYHLSSVDAAAHVVSGMFDGGFTTATFDGNIGSFIHYRVISKDRINVIKVGGVTLS